MIKKKIKTVKCIDNSIYMNESKSPRILEELKMGEIYDVKSQYYGENGEEVYIENSNGYNWWYDLNRFEVVEYYE